MRWQVPGAPIPGSLPFSVPIAQAAASVRNGFPPCWLYAHKVLESGLDDPANIVSADGGHGLFQLTSSFPVDWYDPKANALYAVHRFCFPEIAWWQEMIPGVAGWDLVRCEGASYNAGEGGAWRGHVLDSNVDAFDTDRYGARLVAVAQLLCAGVDDRSRLLAAAGY